MPPIKNKREQGAICFEKTFRALSLLLLPCPLINPLKKKKYNNPRFHIFKTSYIFYKNNTAKSYPACGK